MPSTHEEVTIPLEKINFRGHRHISRWSKEDSVDAFLSILTREDETVFIHTSFHNLFSCGHCDAYPRLERNDDGTYTAATACGYTSGLVSTFTLNVPSGRLAVADSLWGESKLPNPPIDDEDGGPDYNSALGKSLYYKKTEEVGIAYGYVGNTSPSLYINDLTGELFIANTGFADEDDEDREDLGEWGELPAPEGWRKLADIITDLWAYSITDYQHYLNHEGNPDTEHVQFPEVPAGTYTFTHYANDTDFGDEGGLVIFAKADHQPLATAKENTE